MAKVTVLLLATVAAPSMSGCHEQLCSDGEYPVYMKGTLSASGPSSTNAKGSGQMCVKNGSPIPSGYTTYEPGHTPTIN